MFRLPDGFVKYDYSEWYHATAGLILFYSTEDSRVRLYRGNIGDSQERWIPLRVYPENDLESFVDEINSNRALRCIDFNSNLLASDDGSHICCKNCRFYSEEKDNCDQYLKEIG